MPQVFYGLTRGENTYRFPTDYIFNVDESVGGDIGDAYELFKTQETDSNYIVAVAVRISEEQLQIVIKGDYTIDETKFNIVNMTTGKKDAITIPGGTLTLSPASYLGDYPANENKEKQITILNDLETGRKNVVFASIDYSHDNIYNWIRIGSFYNGVDGSSVIAVNSSTYQTIIENVAKVNDTILFGEEFSANNIAFKIGDLYLVNTLNPLTLSSIGNIRGPQGPQGIQGLPGKNGTNGLTPTIGSNGNWFIGSTDTNVKALGTNGTNGVDGQSFSMQSGLYSTLENWGKENNNNPEGEALLQLPTLPQTDISGKGYVVFDPLTTPLEPFYDLYWANNGDTEWTIIHPFNGMRGQDGADGNTPYIKGGTWWIGNTNTGIAATGPQGPQGIGVRDIEITPKSGTTSGNWYDMNITLTNGQVVYGGDFEAPKGPQGRDVKEIYNMEDSESMGYTVTKLGIKLSDGTQLTPVELRAKNGIDGERGPQGTSINLNGSPANTINFQLNGTTLTITTT